MPDQTKAVVTNTTPLLAPPEPRRSAALLRDKAYAMPPQSRSKAPLLQGGRFHFHRNIESKSFWV